MGYDEFMKARDRVRGTTQNNTAYLQRNGIHEGTKQSSKYNKKRYGKKAKAHNPNKKSHHYSNYKLEKIQDQSLTTNSTEPTAPRKINPARLAPQYSTDYKTLLRYQVPNQERL